MRDPARGLTGGGVLPLGVTRVADRLARYASAVGLERWARLVAVAAVPFLLDERSSPILGPVFAALAVYVLLTALVRRDHLVRAADLVVASALIVAAQGQIAPFLLFLVVAVAGPAAQGGVVAGTAAGSTLSLVLLTTLGITGQLPELGVGGALAATMLLPLAGITTASATQVLEDRAVHDRLVLQEANRLLSSLRAIADDIPGGLDVATVSAAVLAEVRTVPGAVATAVLAEDHGVLRPAATDGIAPGAVAAVRIDELRPVQGPARGPRFHTPTALPPALSRACSDHPYWLVLSLGQDLELGALVVGFDDLELGRAGRNRLTSIAADGGLALENARLFDGTRIRAADAASRRIAGDLHDGVAQSLAHLRMELELLARHGPPGQARELDRLARVARSALEDLRATIAGLRRPQEGDLAELLQRHLDEISGARGPALTLEIAGRPSVHGDRADDVLRIAQEAVSNALRHADASTVTVSLEGDGARLELAIEDDGVGIDGQTRRPGSGIGLRSMQERAERLGGELVVRERHGGGTLVLLRCPTQAEPGSAPRPIATGR